jgi:predicted esterase
MNNYEQIFFSGKRFPESNQAIVMVHGRGGTGEDIMNSLSKALHLNDFYIVAPDAEHQSWYPYSFLEPKSKNEPYLTNSLNLLKDIVDNLVKTGYPTEAIYLLGFSQGACLTLEFAAQHARRYGGVFALSGGLIGDELNVSDYTGNFEGTPVFLGCSDIDSHIPLGRVKDSTELLLDRGATVYEKIYPGMGHTINQDEIKMVTELIKYGRIQ